MGYKMPLSRLGGGHFIDGVGGETLSSHQIVYLDSNGQWKKADVDSVTSITLLGITMDAIELGSIGRIMLNGPIGLLTWSWSKGGKLYASKTPGSLTQTMPVPTVGGVVVCLGYALETDLIFFNPETSRPDDSARMRVLTYTGDGNATKAITGVKFEPDFIILYPQLGGGTYEAFKGTPDGTKTFVDRSGSNNDAYEDDHIISFDADGFTVGDGTGGVGNFFNVLNRVYVAICFKNYT